jgi:magnesium-protoporphyrin O-methyltransferase
MISHLASLAEDRLIISFAPYTPWLALLKRIGELFPGPSKARQTVRLTDPWTSRWLYGRAGS